MEQERIPKPGQFYRHFKNKLYQIIALAKHSETGEDMVVYQALYGDFGIYVRPLDMFISEVDIKKYPDISQKYRFEQVILSKEDGQKLPFGDNRIENPPNAIPAVKQEETGVNPVLMSFLEADSYEDKLQILIGKKKELTDSVLNHMAMSLDCTLNDGEFEERFDSLIYCLQTLTRFESSRLR